MNRSKFIEPCVGANTPVHPGRGMPRPCEYA
jgi:hypothetical protein